MFRSIHCLPRSNSNRHQQRQSLEHQDVALIMPTPMKSDADTILAEFKVLNMTCLPLTFRASGQTQTSSSTLIVQARFHVCICVKISLLRSKLPRLSCITRLPGCTPSHLNPNLSTLTQNPNFQTRTFSCAAWLAGPTHSFSGSVSILRRISPRQQTPTRRSPQQMTGRGRVAQRRP